MRSIKLSTSLVQQVWLLRRRLPQTQGSPVLEGGPQMSSVLGRCSDFVFAPSQRHFCSLGLLGKFGVNLCYGCL